MQNYFIGTKEHPHHISIGGVLRNQKGEVAAHYFKHFSHPAFGDAENFYILMRETPELGESMEETLMRGLMEEFGATASLVSFLGTIVSHFPKRESIIEKTTLYFLCDLESIDETKRAKDDLETASEIRWIAPQELISLMEAQRARINREDLDESKVLRALAEEVS